MNFTIRWVPEARDAFERLQRAAQRAVERRRKSGKRKSSKAEGLFQQVLKTIELLSTNPRHPGLHTHEYSGLDNPFDPAEKVWEAYAQNRTPGAYRLFWCYGPGEREITLLAITPHP